MTALLLDLIQQTVRANDAARRSAPYVWGNRSRARCNMGGFHRMVETPTDQECRKCGEQG
jgi:hypothetical protein